MAEYIVGATPGEGKSYNGVGTTVWQMQSDRPGWWTRNRELREELGLPEYEPSRLLDGAYVHEVVDELEATYGCEIEFVSLNPSYPSRWEVLVDGEAVTSMTRERDERGNNVYQVSAEDLRTRVGVEQE